MTSVCNEFQSLQWVFLCQNEFELENIEEWSEAHET